MVPLNFIVFYEVELVSFVKEKKLWGMNMQEEIEAAGAKKEKGNVLPKAGKFVKVPKRYEKAVKYIEYDFSFDDEEKKQAKVVRGA